MDEPHYISTLVALKVGRVTAVGTDGLPPSPELAWFDPVNRWRRVESAPVAPNAPPLWAPLVLPFSFLGWRGLVAVNALAFVVTTLVVQRLAARTAGSAAAGWWAAAALGLGGFAIEYAQGVWPQCLSMAFTTGAFALTLRAVERSEPGAGFGAGWLAGLATGLRYQNVIVAAALAAVLLLRGRARALLLAAFAAGALIPLGASSIINHRRLDSWNPVSKGPGYLKLRTDGGTGSRVADAAIMTYARLVDYSARPFDPSFGWYWMYRGSSGALLVAGVVKKALLQSAPWAALALAWALAETRNGRSRDSRARELALASLVVVGFVVGAFSVAGVRRDDGLTYNQRYLLELVPVLAVGFGVSMRRAAAAQRTLLESGLLTALLVTFGLGLVSDPLAQHVVRFAPLALALALVLAGRRTGAVPERVLGGLAAAALTWAFTIHVSTDLMASRGLRAAHLGRAEGVRGALPSKAAIVAWGGRKDFLASIVLEGNQTVIDAGADDGQAARATVDALLARGDRVFVWTERMPKEVRERIFAGRFVRPVAKLANRVVCVELREPPE